VVVDEHALAFDRAFNSPFALPAQAVEAVRLGEEIRRQHDFAFAETKAPVADAVAVRSEREAGAFERVPRFAWHRTEHVEAAVAQRGDRAADLWAEFGFPIA
jgi:hypothetical protein